MSASSAPRESLPGVKNSWGRGGCIFSLTDTIGVGFSLYQGVVGGRGKIFLPDPAPVFLAGPHAPEIELCLKESETSGSQSIGGGDFSSSNSSLSLRHSPIMWRRRLKEEAAAAAAAAAAAEKRRKQEVAGSSPGEVICFQILTSQMGSPAPVGGAGACLVAPKWFCLRYLVRVFFLSHKFSLTGTTGVGFSLYQEGVGGRGWIFLIDPSPRCPPRGKALENPAVP